MQLTLCRRQYTKGGRRRMKQHREEGLSSMELTLSQHRQKWSASLMSTDSGAVPNQSHTSRSHTSETARVSMSGERLLQWRMMTWQPGWQPEAQVLYLEGHRFTANRRHREGQGLYARHSRLKRALRAGTQHMAQLMD